VAAAGFSYVPEKNVRAMQNAIMQAPISVSIDADNAAVENYVSGVITDASICGTDLDHALTVVGYNTTGPQPYWIVRNSWGSDWGEGGYFKVLMSDGSGVCGINLDVTFPNMALAFGQQEFTAVMVILSFVLFVLTPAFYYQFYK